MPVYSILFLSSAEIAVPLLQALSKDSRFRLVGLICQPDKPAGRGQPFKQAATKIFAQHLGLPVYQEHKLSLARELLKSVRMNPPDFLLTFAYGQIISEEWLSIAKIAPLNVHASLLPKYRGASPIQAAILNGDPETGITVMKMDTKMDSGPIAGQAKIPLDEHMSFDLLHDALALLAASFVPDELIRIAEGGKGVFSEQDHSKASYTKKITRENGRIDFLKPAPELYREFHAYTPWPGLFTTFNGKRLKILDLEVTPGDLPPGTVRCENHRILMGTSDGDLSVKQLQLEGKQALHADQFVLGQPNFCHSSLGNPEIPNSL